MKYSQFVVLTAVIAVLIAANHLQAWTPPATTPPTGNVASPINTGTTDQVKSGGLGVEKMSVSDAFGFSFINYEATGNPTSAWRLVRNDGSGYFHIYVNTLGRDKKMEGGEVVPASGWFFETDAGYAYHEKYSTDNGIYTYQSSKGASAGVNSSITWQDNMRLHPDGRVAVRKVCDINGNNCSNKGITTTNVLCTTSGNCIDVDDLINNTSGSCTFEVQQYGSCGPGGTDATSCPAGWTLIDTGTDFCGDDDCATVVQCGRNVCS